MKVYVENRSEQDLPLSRIEPLAEFVLVSEGIPANTELSISFVGIDEMQSLNLMYRDCDCATDVLSFEMDLPWDEDGSPEDAWTDAEQILIGDVVINPNKARENIVIDEVSFEEELWILLIHGILHLIGYEHDDDDDRILMEEKEDELFIDWIRRTEKQDLTTGSVGSGSGDIDTQESEL